MMSALLRFYKRHTLSRILSQRMCKATVNSTIALIFCLIPKVRGVLGEEPSMLPLISVMVHPGRRFGTMIEAVIFAMSGLLLGNAYALLARFLAQKAIGSSHLHLVDTQQYHQNYINYEAALAILSVFEMMMLFFHGWMRSVSHKFFAIVFPLFLVVHFAFTDNINQSAGEVSRNYTIPFFLGIAISLMCNLIIFPEFGSSYLGTSIIETLNELHLTIDHTVQYFVTLENSQDSPYSFKLKSSLSQIVSKKNTLRAKLNSTQAVLQECIYEISYSYLSPVRLKKLIEILKSELTYVNALINACQLEFTVLEMRKPDVGKDYDLLSQALKRARAPIFKLHKSVSQSLYLIKLALARSYDVKIRQVSKSINIDLIELDITNVEFDEKINDLAKSIANFEITIREELKNINTKFENFLAPNDDMFLLSSFLMNLKETSNSICNIMKETRVILEYRLRQEKKSPFGRKLWFSFLTSTDQLRGWFNANSNDFINANETATLNGDNHSKVYSAASDQRGKEDLNSIQSSTKWQNVNLDNNQETLTKDLRKIPVYDRLISCYFSTYNRYKPHFRFGFQVMVGLMLASFPMFVPKARHWYVDIRGTWIGFVCILVLEPQVGSTFFVFFLRGVGVVTGSAWGYLSYVSGIHQTNPYLETVITVIGAIPGFYFFLGTPYVKAAIIGIISIYIVLLSTALPSSIGGSILVNFGKRCLAMIYGGAVALFCQVIFFPIKARDELIKEISSATGHIANLFLIYSVGLDNGNNNFSMTQERFLKFEEISDLAKNSLIRADAYRSSAKKEPRLKGSYKDIETVLKEIISILREILDRLDNIVLLRKNYGSAIIEEFNSVVYQYRRQLTASNYNVLKAVEYALITKAPLPQYLPSPKVAQKRLIAKVCQVIQSKYSNSLNNADENTERDDESDSEIFIEFQSRSANRFQNEDLLKAKFFSWNATSSTTEEIINYIEELIELTKLLVGVNEFKYGFLSRTLISDYATKAIRNYKEILLNNDCDQNGSTTTGANDLQTIESINSSIARNPEPLIVSDANSAEFINSDSRSTNISEHFRKRVYSIGSWIKGDNNSIGDYDGSEELDDYNEAELPVSLMRVISKKITHIDQ